MKMQVLNFCKVISTTMIDSKIMGDLKGVVVCIYWDFTKFGPNIKV